MYLTCPSFRMFVPGFSRRVLEISGGVTDLGTVRIPLMLTLLLAWVLVYFSIWKSIRSSGKVGFSAGKVAGMQ